jgi:hypothetical protein
MLWTPKYLMSLCLYARLNTSIAWSNSRRESSWHVIAKRRILCSTQTPWQNMELTKKRLSGLVNVCRRSKSRSKTLRRKPPKLSENVRFFKSQIVLLSAGFSKREGLLRMNAFPSSFRSSPNAPTLYTRSWNPFDSFFTTHACVVIMHGLAEHCGR